MGSSSMVNIGYLLFHLCVWKPCNYRKLQIQTQTFVSHKYILTAGKYFNRTQTLHGVKMNQET